MWQRVLIISGDAPEPRNNELAADEHGMPMGSRLQLGGRNTDSEPWSGGSGSSGLGNCEFGPHQKNEKIQGVVKCLTDRVTLVLGETPESQVMGFVP